MKKILCTLALCLSASAFVHAQSTKGTAIKVNIFSPVVKTGSFFIERKLNDKSTAQLGVGFTAYKTGDLKISGIFFTPEYRHYLTGEALNGVYLAPFLRYQNLKLEDSESDPRNPDKATLTTFGGGLAIGRQWLFRDLISLDVFLGPSYNSGSIKVTSGNQVEDVPGVFSGFGIRTGVTLGIAF